MSMKVIQGLVNERMSLMVAERASRRELEKVQKRLDQLDALLEGVDLGAAATVEPPAPMDVPSPASQE